MSKRYQRPPRFTHTRKIPPAGVTPAKSDPVFVVEQKSFGLTLARKLAVVTGVVGFALPFVPWFLWVSRDEQYSGLLAFVSGIGQLLAVLLAVVVGSLLGALFWIGVPKVYQRCFPNTRRQVCPLVTSDGLELGSFGQFEWAKTQVRYPYSSSLLKSGIGVFGPHRSPLLITEDTSSSATLDDLFHDIQAHLPPVALPAVDHDGVVRSSSGQVENATGGNIVLCRHDGGAVLYEQSTPTALKYIADHQYVLLHHSGEAPKGQWMNYFAVGLMHFVVAVWASTFVVWLFQSVSREAARNLALLIWIGWPVSMVVKEMRKPIAGWEVVKWIDLDKRALCVRSVRHIRNGEKETHNETYPLGEVILIRHRHQWENTVTYDLGLALKAAVNQCKKNEGTPYLCQIFSSSRSEWTSEIALAAAAKWNVEILQENEWRWS